MNDRDDLRPVLVNANGNELDPRTMRVFPTRHDDGRGVKLPAPPAGVRVAARLVFARVPKAAASDLVSLTITE